MTPAERDARTAAWQTTLLGLGNEVGQVVSMTHPEIPGVHGTCNVSGSTATWVSGDSWAYAGTATGDSELVNKVILIGGSQVTITAVASDGSTITTSPAPPSGSALPFQVITMCFRIQRWSLKKDWSVQIEAQTVTASMYDLDVGPKPMDVVPAPMPALFYQIPLGPVWAPYQVQASSSDALFPGEWTFDSDQEYTTLADGSALASLILTGKLPVNEFSATGAGAPGHWIDLAEHNGRIAAGRHHSVGWCLRHRFERRSFGSIQHRLHRNRDSVGRHIHARQHNLASSCGPRFIRAVRRNATRPDLRAGNRHIDRWYGRYLHARSITFGGPVLRSTWALPSPYVGKVRIKAKLLIHAGVAGIAVTSVSTNTLVSDELIDTSSTPYNFTGRKLSLIGRPDGSTPFASFNITAHVPSTGTLTLDRDPTGIVNVGDAVVVRNKASGCRVTGLGHPDHRPRLSERHKLSGMTPGVEVGNLIRVIAGAGHGQARRARSRRTRRRG